MKTIVLKGENVEEKLAHAEKILNRIIPKLRNVATAVIPPVPVFVSAKKPDENGTIAKVVMPTSGKIIAGAMFVGKYAEKKAVGFSCGVSNDSGASSYKFSTRRTVETMTLDLEVVAGSILSLETDMPEMIEDIHAAFLIQFPVSASTIETRMIEELEAIQDEGVQLED